MRALPVFSCLLLVAANVLASEEIRSDDGVLVLTKDNFQQAITENVYVLVEFYAPWCGHCKALTPEYARAAKLLVEDNSNIKLAKVDATEENELAEKFQVRGYPTLKFFRAGEPVDYAGGRTAEEIVTWLSKKIGPPVEKLDTVKYADEFIAQEKTVIVGCFKDLEGQMAKDFVAASNAMDSFMFGITDKEEVVTKHGAKGCDSVILFKTFEEKKNIFQGEINLDNLKKFVEVYSMPLIIEFNHESAQQIFGGTIKSHLLFFISKEAGHIEKYVDPLRDVAQKFREDVLFVTIDGDEDDHQRIFEFFGMTKNDVPAMRLIKLEDDMAKYKPESDEFTPEAIQDFVQKYLDGKLKQHLLSQPLPEDWDKHPVKVLVASNFDKVVFDETKDVLVEFYAPWCGHCKQLAPVFEQLGEKYKDSETVVIAKIDATANELEHTKITAFPVIKLYRKGDNQAIDYSLDRTFDALVKFVDAGGSIGEATEEDEKEGEEEEEDADVPAEQQPAEEQPEEQPEEEHKKDEL